MTVPGWRDVELEEAWIDGDPSARWSSSAIHGSGSGAAASGSSAIGIEPGSRLPRHTDSAEEVVVVISGAALVAISSEEHRLAAGGIAVIPEGVPHEVHSVAEEPLRFAAIYAAADVTSTYEAEVQPGGSRTRRAVA
jgi:quercetin dioxygenase-like cupin family protein